MDDGRIRIRIICAGDSAVFRTIGIPLSEKIEADLSSEGIEFHTGELPELLQLDSRPRNDISVIAATIGMLVITAGRLVAQKFFDEFWAAKISPTIQKVFNSTKVQSLANKPGKKWLFQLAVLHEEEHVLVLLTLVGDTLKEVCTQELLLPSLHSQAVNWLIQNRNDSPVHLYIAEHGKANVAPLTFDNNCDAQRYIKSLWPVIIPTDGGAAGAGAGFQSTNGR